MTDRGCVLPVLNTKHAACILLSTTSLWHIPLLDDSSLFVLLLATHACLSVLVSAAQHHRTPSSQARAGLWRVLPTPLALPT